MRRLLAREVDEHLSNANTIRFSVWVLDCLHQGFPTIKDNAYLNVEYVKMNSDIIKGLV